MAWAGRLLRHFFAASATENATWPLPAEHPLMVRGKWTQQETALPWPGLGGDLTPIDVQGEGAEPAEDVSRVLPPCTKEVLDKNRCLCPRIVMGGRASSSHKPSAAPRCQPAQVPFGVLLSFLSRFLIISL